MQEKTTDERLQWVNAEIAMCESRLAEYQSYRAALIKRRRDLEAGQP